MFKFSPYEKFPEQKGGDRPDIEYQSRYTANPTKVLATPVIAKKTFGKRTTHESEEVTSWADKVWEEKKGVNSKIFNGGQLAVYCRPNKDDSFKVVKTDFKLVSSSRRTAGVVVKGEKHVRPEALPLRDHFNVGVIILCVTQDNKLLININKDKEGKPRDLQFPGGFIGGDKGITVDDLIAHIQEDGSLYNVVAGTVVKEGTEEIVRNFKDSVEGKSLCLGYIGKPFSWPKKGDSEPKERFSIKSFVVLQRSKQTFAELMGERASDAPADADELPHLIPLDIEEFAQHDPKNPMQVTCLADKIEVPFAAEHGYVAPLLKEFLQQQKGGMLEKEGVSVV